MFEKLGRVESRSLGHHAAGVHRAPEEVLTKNSEGRSIPLPSTTFRGTSQWPDSELRIPGYAGKEAARFGCNSQCHPWSSAEAWHVESAAVGRLQQDLDTCARGAEPDRSSDRDDQSSIIPRFTFER